MTLLQSFKEALLALRVNLMRSFLTMLGIIGTFQVFNQAYIMTKGGPNESTLFYIYYLYTKAFTDSEMGYASALAWVLFVIVLVITVLLFRNSRWVYYEMGDAR